MKTTTSGPSMLNSLRTNIATLPTGYFALVMATGIISIAAFFLDLKPVSYALLVLNTINFITLWILMIIRLVCYFPKVIADIKDHARGPGFFTTVAGTCVFGSQLVVLLKSYSIASYLWGFSIFLWFIIMYSFFTAVITRTEKPTLQAGINGAWLIAAVATQSVAALGGLIANYHGNPPVLLFFSLAMYLLGCMLYLNIITLIFYRFTFLEFTAATLTPLYWINMGAVAITSLAGSILILGSKQWPLLQELTPFLKGFTLFFWTAGTWWVPILIILGLWRHLYMRLPLTYDPQYWGMVFPLGMYTASTVRLSQALEIPFLLNIPRYFVFIAILAWVITYLGMGKQIIKSLRAS